MALAGAEAVEVATNKTPIISMKDISKIYNIGGEEVHALDKACFSISEGEYVSIVGPSGSGKSTLMNIIGCLDVADEGKYTLDGQAIEQYSEKELARIRNKKIGFIYQGFDLLPRMTAEENEEVPLIQQGVRSSERKKQVQQALERVGLSERRSHKPTELSGGQQQRVAIARALVTHPAILLADEPTGNLDTKTGNDIIQLFNKLNESGNTIILITHNDDIAALADRRIRIIDGHVEEAG